MVPPRALSFVGVPVSLLGEAGQSPPSRRSAWVGRPTGSARSDARPSATLRGGTHGSPTSPLLRRCPRIVVGRGRAKPALAATTMGRASDWLREERRKTLGDWVAFCVGCGHVQRYFAGFEEELPDVCPTCAGELRVRCPECDARIGHAFAVTCDDCGA